MLANNMGKADTKEVMVFRGYNHYGEHDITHPVYPIVEPLVLVAGLAFLAYLLQMLHTFYLSHHTQYSYTAATTTRPTVVGSVGSLVDSLVPTRLRELSNDLPTIQQQHQSQVDT